ncbi:MAG TPA: hypothetical protein VGL35_05550 [Rhizomicrobium sp.]|jgi:hypothetical protein
MIAHKETSTRAETAALRLRQRQIGRELRLLYERLLRDPLPEDMIDALHEAKERRPETAPGNAKDPLSG